jgi:hypothetical protein
MTQGRVDTSIPMALLQHFTLCQNLFYSSCLKDHSCLHLELYTIYSLTFARLDIYIITADKLKLFVKYEA